MGQHPYVAGEKTKLHREFDISLSQKKRIKSNQTINTLFRLRNLKYPDTKTVRNH